MNSILASGEFWRSVLERALSTFLQSGIGALVAIPAMTGFTSVPWFAIGNVALVAAVLSLAKSIVAGLATGVGPSVGATEVVTSNVVALADYRKRETVAGPASELPDGTEVEVKPRRAA